MPTDLGGLINPDTFILGGLFDKQVDQNNQPYVEYVSGGHIWRQSVDPKGHATGAVQDMGNVGKAPKPNTPHLVQQKDGSVHAIVFDGEGNVVGNSEISGPVSAAAKPTDPSLTAKRDADTAYVKAKTAEAEAQAPYSRDKAQATIDLARAHIQQIADLDPAKAKLLEAQADAAASRVGLNASAAKKNESAAALNDAKVQKMLAPVFGQVAGELANLQDMRDQGVITQEQYDQAKQGLLDNAVAQARTGLTAEQSATIGNNAQSTAVTQANSRNTSALDFTRNAFDTVSGIATKGAAPGQGDMLANGFLAMLHAGQGMSSAMGGNPVNVTPGGGMINSPVTPAHAQEIAQLVTSGGVPADANGDRFPNAVKAVAAKYGILPSQGGAPAAPAPTPSPTGAPFDAASQAGDGSGSVPWLGLTGANA